MRILCIGDVVGAAGCAFLRAHLSALKNTEHIDLVVANGENSADGNGMTPTSAEHLFTSGVDVITGGNHTYRRKEIYRLLDENPRIVRPANYPAADPGVGYTLVDTLKARVCVVSLLGTVFMENLESPFTCADGILNTIESGTIILVDFHAEATSEKRALACYLDGRVAAVFGTHTHVQTADEQILPGGTGFISDIGMTGPENSVLGVDPQLAIRRFMTKMPVRFTAAKGDCFLSGIILDINDKTCQTNFIDRIQIK